MNSGTGDLRGCLRCAPARRRSTRSTGDAAVREEAFFEVVTNRRRRECLRYLLSVDREAVVVAELVDHLFSVEAEAPDAEEVGDRRKSIYVSLRQTHLPLLAEHNVVTFESDENVVRTDENLGVFSALAADGDSAEDADADYPRSRSRSPSLETVLLAILTLGWLVAVVVALYGSSLARTVVVTVGYVVVVALVEYAVGD